MLSLREDLFPASFDVCEGVWDGIITRTESQALVDAIAETGLSGVELRPTESLNNRLPVVRTNDHAAGRLAAEHFLENQFRHFGCCTVQTRQKHPQFNDRCEGFVTASEAAGYVCSVHRSTSRREEPANWESQQDDLSAWVSGLPKPVGVLATTDQMGFWLLDACSRAGVCVPEDVAVVGVEDDELLCEMTTPPLSSVRLNTQRIGYEAARLLDRLMAGQQAPSESLKIDPLYVVTRQSSDVLAVEDQDVVAAVRFIREHACDGITVADVVAAIHLSRSPLERKMRDTLGRSPMAEIRRVQFNRVKQLLIDTDLSLSKIAEKTGFAHPQYLSDSFKKAFECTPGVYRQDARHRQNF